MRRVFVPRIVGLALLACVWGCTPSDVAPSSAKPGDENQAAKRAVAAPADDPVHDAQPPDRDAGSRQAESADEPPKTVTTEPPSTRAKPTAKPGVVHADFRSAFTPAHMFTGKQDKWTMWQVTVAPLVVKSGKLVAADPGTIQFEENRRPFNRTIKPGKYPVTLAMAKFSNGDQRCACVRLELKKATAVRWEMATRTGEKLESLRIGEMYVFGVDSGKACLVDAEAIDSIDDAGEYERLFYDEFGKRREAREPVWGEMAVGETGANLIGFDAGYGDGGYPSFWGFDAAGEVVELVIDFGLLTENIESELVIEKISELLGKPIEQEELVAAGIALRLTSRAQDESKLDVVIAGARSGSCRLVLVNGDPRHDSRNVGTVSYEQHKVSYTLEISQPLRDDAKLEVRFTKGRHAL